MNSATNRVNILAEVDKLLEVIITILKMARMELVGQLEAKLKTTAGIQSFKVENDPQSGFGKREVNDYGLRVWIDVEVNGRRYIISLLYTGADENGNYHPQVGRIRVWEEIEPPGDGKIGMGNIYRDDEGRWFTSVKDSDIGLTREQMTIYSDDYDPGLVIDEFIKFVI